MDFSGRIAVVTGAGSGIGRELACACAREGASVVLADIDEPGLAETARRISTPAMQVRCDVSKAGDLEALAEKTYAGFGAAHHLFNNAGVAVGGPTWTATLHDWKCAAITVDAVRNDRFYVLPHQKVKTPSRRA